MAPPKHARQEVAPVLEEKVFSGQGLQEPSLVFTKFPGPQSKTVKSFLYKQVILKPFKLTLHLALPNCQELQKIVCLCIINALQYLPESGIMTT